MKILLILCLSAIVFVSGCVGIEENEIPKDIYCDDMSLTEAIVWGMNSCSEVGKLDLDSTMCNEITHTWWIDIDEYEPNPMCNPACVIHTETKEVEINWRCTGALPP